MLPLRRALIGVVPFVLAGCSAGGSSAEPVTKRLELQEDDARPSLERPPVPGGAESRSSGAEGHSDSSGAEAESRAVAVRSGVSDRGASAEGSDAPGAVVAPRRDRGAGRAAADVDGFPADDARAPSAEPNAAPTSAAGDAVELRGEVASVSVNKFTLISEGPFSEESPLEIRLEQWGARAYEMVDPGDRVVVRGVPVDPVFEHAGIRARSIYVPDLDRTFRPRERRIRAAPDG